MVSKIITASTVVLSLSFMPVDRAQADKAGAFAAGALIGGLVGHAITKENQRKKAAATRQSTTSNPVFRRLTKVARYKHHLIILDLMLERLMGS
jgi:uncharacterized protein YcfJ